MSDGTRYAFLQRAPGDWATHPDRPCGDPQRGSDRERSRIWFSDNASEQTLARDLCQTCPVQEACLEYALDNNEEYGTWGGVSERGRKRLLAARQPNLGRYRDPAECPLCGGGFANRGALNNHLRGIHGATA